MLGDLRFLPRLIGLITLGRRQYSGAYVPTSVIQGFGPQGAGVRGRGSKD